MRIIAYKPYQYKYTQQGEYAKPVGNLPGNNIFNPWLLLQQLLYNNIYINCLCLDVYHQVFVPPKNKEVAQRLIEEPGGLEENVLKPLALYHRHAQSVLSCYQNKSNTFNSDQPIGDLFAQGMLYIYICVCVCILYIYIYELKTSENTSKRVKCHPHIIWRV